MRLFEAAWRQGYEFFERYYDTDLNKSIQSEITVPFEWYEPKSSGLYEYILDPSIKLMKKQGKQKDSNNMYGVTDPIQRHIRDTYWGKEQYNTDPRIWYLDIETRVGTVSKGFPVPEKALEPISLMQIYDNKSDTMIVLGTREWKHRSDYSYDYEVTYIKCKDEIELINTYIAIFKKLNPLIIYAWNGLGFDYPYIYNRMARLELDTNQLSNYGSVELSEREFQGMKHFNITAKGHYYIDLMEVYKKFIFTMRASYSLDSIAELELKMNKVSHTEYSAFDDFYTGKYNIPSDPTQEQKDSKIYQEALKGNWDEVKELAHSEFVHYGCIDTFIIKQLDDKLNFTALMFMISEKMGVNLSDSMGTIKPWANYISNKSMKEKKIMPPRQEHDQPDVVGGYVREPNVGKHNWVLSVDVNSMYPLLGMVGFNMSPETYLKVHELPDDLKDIVLSKFNDQDDEQRMNITPEEWEFVSSILTKHKLSLGINGAVFQQDRLGMVPELVQDIYKTRKQAKKTMFKFEQQKILIEQIIKEKSSE